MALGLPVISTNVGGIPYLIESDTTGILVPPNDVSVFTTAICSLLKDGAMATKLSRNARTKVEKFDWQEVKSLWLSLLSE
jgi:glycosyltransferase involved in cell wall biosynthesis